MPTPAGSNRPTPVRWVTARLDELFFTRGSAAELGWLRLLFYGIVLVLSFSFQRDFALWSGVSREFWHPTFFFQVLPIPVLSTTGLLAVLWIWRLSLFCSAIGYGGVAPRVVAAGLGFYVLGLPHNFGKVSHNDAIVSITLLIFAVAQVNAAWSIDSLRRKLRSGGGSATVDGTSTAEASWPISLVRLMVALVLWSAAIAKLRDAGIAWVVSDNIYNTIVRHHYTHEPFTDIGLVFARSALVCQLLAAISLTLEFLAPALVFLRGWWRAALLAGVLGMMLGFGFTLGVLFLHLCLMLGIFFLPWPAMGAALARVWQRPRFVVVYDGSCGLCRRTMVVLRSLDVFGNLEIYDAVSEWDVLHRRFPHLSPDACLKDMHVLICDDGRVRVGYAGYRALAAALPLAWLALPFLYLPGAQWIGNRIYRRVAARRHAEGCALPAMPASQA